jgi:hypothetical protein
MVAKSIKQILVKHTDKIIIFIFPILLASLNSNWIFSPATDFIPDPWFYLAYFRYFYVYAPAFPSNVYYFVERLTWNVPGYYVYQILPPLQANYILHLSVCYIALFSLFGTLRILFNQRTALVSTLLMGSYPWFLRAVGWDYVDGVGIAQMLLLVYILTVASRSKQWKRYLFFAGIIHASLFITNLFWLGFAPSWAVYFLLLNYPISKGKALKLFGEVCYFLLGTVTLLVILGFFYHSVTGEYFFLKTSVVFAAARSRNVELINTAIRLYGDMIAYWHIIPMLVALGAIWHLRKNMQNLYRDSFLAIVCLFALAYGWLIFAHFYSWRYLIIFLYSSFAIPAVFLLIGALLATVFDCFSDRHFTIITAVAILTLAAPYILVVLFPFLKNWQGNIFLILFLSLIFIVNISLIQKKSLVLPLLIAFSAMSFLGATNAYVFLPDPLENQREFAAIINASRAIDSFYPNHSYSDFRLWFREDKNYATFFSLSALYLYTWGSAINHPESGKSPPTLLTFPTTEKSEDGDRIIVISSNSNTDEVIAEANRALAYRNVVLIVNELKEIQEGPLQFTLYFSKIKTITDK